MCHRTGTTEGSPVAPGTGSYVTCLANTPASGLPRWRPAASTIMLRRCVIQATSRGSDRHRHVAGLPEQPRAGVEPSDALPPAGDRSLVGLYPSSSVVVGIRAWPVTDPAVSHRRCWGNPRGVGRREEGSSHAYEDCLLLAT